MPELFDPYKEWLGIPPSQQPANHYRLLGLDSFESDPTKIELAVSKRVEFLQAVSLGANVAAAQKLLNQVAKARLCLIDPEKKRVYDQRLRKNQSLSSVNEASPVTAKSKPTDKAGGLSSTKKAHQNSKSVSKVAMVSSGKSGNASGLGHHESTRSSFRTSFTLLWTGVLCFLLVFVFALFYFYTASENRNDSNETVAQSTSQSSPPQSVQTGKGTKVDEPSNVIPTQPSESKKGTRKDKSDHSKTKDSKQIVPKSTDASPTKRSLPQISDVTTKSSETTNSSETITKAFTSAAKMNRRNRPNAIPEKPLSLLRPDFHLPESNQKNWVLIDELYLSDNAKLEIKLAFNSSILKPNVGFSIEKMGDRIWQIQQKRRKQKQPIAEVRHHQDELQFRWLSNPKESLPDECNFLSNCELKLQHSKKQVARIGLRYPKSTKRFILDPKTLTADYSVEIPNMMLSENLKLTVQKFWGSDFEECVVSPMTVTAQSPARIFFSGDKSKQFIWVEVEGRITQVQSSNLRVNLSASVKIKLDDRVKQLRKISSFEEIIDQLERESQKVSKQARLKNAVQKRQLNTLAQSLKDQSKTCQQFKAILVKAFKKVIPIRLTIPIDGRPVLLAKSGSDRPEAVTWLPSQVPEFKDFELVYDYDFSPLSENKKIRYRVDRSNLVGEFNRVAYLFELVPRNSQWPNMVFVSMDPFSRDVADLGIPRNQKVQFQTKVFNLNTYSNVKGFKRGVGIPEGMIEFYRQGYDPQKSSVLNIGSDVVRDFNDTMTNAIYGSFQVHDLANQQTIFAFNNFFQTNVADVGIGNNTIKGSDGIAHPDWTFRKNAQQFLKKRLRIYVRPIARKATH